MVLSSQSNHEKKKLPDWTPEEKAILTTLAYSSLFSFPLDKNELWQYLISSEPIDKQALQRCLKALHEHIAFQGGYYTLKGNEAHISRRIQYIGEVSKKMTLASHVVSKLRHISSIEFIGISGGLAAKNVTPEDDIDLFIIVKKNTVFMSRFLILLVLEMLGLRRKRKQKKVANKICVNLIIDTTSIAWGPDNQDIYTAREIAQVKPLYEKNNTYSVFLQKNKWVTAYLPNAYEALNAVQVVSEKPSKLTQSISYFLSFRLFEEVMKNLQKASIEHHKTSEIITNHHLAFHPKDYRAETLQKLKLIMRQLGLLTKV
jgi:hypothetical protein